MRSIDWSSDVCSSDLATKVSIGRDVGANDIFDLIVERERAATGEERLGGLAFAGLELSGKNVELVRWTVDGRDQWLDARGKGTHTTKSGGMPVSGHITSSRSEEHTSELQSLMRNSYAV